MIGYDFCFFILFIYMKQIMLNIFVYIQLKTADNS